MSALDVGCPTCGVDKGRYCATWDELAGGMVTRDGLLHPDRLLAAITVAQADAVIAGTPANNATEHIVTDAQLGKAADVYLFKPHVPGVPLEMAMADEDLPSL